MRSLPGLAAALAAGLIVLWIGQSSVLEAWLLGFMLLAGVSVGAVALLLTGRILGEIWLQPIRADLEAMATFMPIVAVLALPVLLYPQGLYPWAAGDPAPADRAWLDPGFFIVRGLIYLAVWIAVASLARRRDSTRTVSGIGLVVLVLSVSLATLDWLGSREPEWISGLYGPAFVVSQLLCAMAVGLLLTLIRPGHPAMIQVESLRTALVALALLTAWMWFSQFLIVWMGDLPPESAWYLRRAGPWLVLEAVAVAALLAAILLLLAPHAGHLRLVVVSSLVIVQHLAHTLWLVRPAAHGLFPAALTVMIPASLIGLWLVFLIQELRRANLAAHAS